VTQQPVEFFNRLLRRPILLNLNHFGLMPRFAGMGR
jgi:hypothetical protein